MNYYSSEHSLLYQERYLLSPKYYLQPKFKDIYQLYIFMHKCKNTRKTKNLRSAREVNCEKSHSGVVKIISITSTDEDPSLR